MQMITLLRRRRTRRGQGAVDWPPLSLSLSLSLSFGAVGRCNLADELERDGKRRRVHSSPDICVRLQYYTRTGYLAVAMQRRRM
jgi:hypothetical protein